MNSFLTEQEFAIAMAVVSTATMMMGFVLGFSLCYIEKELIIGEIHELVDKAIEKKFERDDYVIQLENTIVQLQQNSTSDQPSVKRRRVDSGSSSDKDFVVLPPPQQPLERCVGRCVSDRSDKEPIKED